MHDIPVRPTSPALARPPPALPRPPAHRVLSRCRFLLQNLRFETEIGISTAYGWGRGWCGRAGWCVCGRRVRGWRAGSAARATGGSIRGDGVVLTDERISTDEQVDAVVVLDQQHSIRLGQRRKCRGSHVHARDKPFLRIHSPLPAACNCSLSECGSASSKRATFTRTVVARSKQHRNMRALK